MAIQTTTPVAERVAALLLIRPGEGRRTALLFVQLLLASAIFILGRTVRDTLFLSRFPVQALPWMFVLYGVASALTVVIYGRFADKLARHTVIAASAAIGIASYIAVWVLVKAGVSMVYPVFYVWSEVFANLFIVQFWTLANDLHDARSAKRLFGTIGAARVLGVIVIGVTAGVLVRAIGTEQLLFVLAAMMAAVAWVARLLRDEPRPSTVRPTAPARRVTPVASDPYVRSLAVMILLCFTALTVGDYQFKVIARSTYREDALAQFFGWFYAGTGLVSLAFQLFVTPRLLRRLGVSWGMTVMPAVFGSCAALLLAMPRLAVATVMKFADNGFQYTIHETTLQSLYVPFAASTKARTRALLDAVVKPCSYGAGGLVLIVAASRLSVERLSWITSALVLLWLASIPIVKRRYARSLQATLSARGLLALEEADLVLDAAAREAIGEVLRSGEPRRILAALEQVDAAKMPELAATLEQLVGHDSADVRAEALLKLAAMSSRSRGLIAARLGDDEARVRAAAASCYARLAGDEAVELLLPLLDDPVRKVRVASLAGLMSYGGVDGAISGGGRLGHLLTGSAKQRAEAARVLGSLGSEAYRPLVGLLHDEKPKVRRAALKACAGVADARLVEPLLDQLYDPACRKRASAALIAVGEPAVKRLAALLERADTPRALRAQLPYVLQRIGSAAAYSSLHACMGIDDSLVRAKVYSALSHLREEQHVRPAPLDLIVAQIEMEIRDGLSALQGWEVLRTELPTPLLEEEAQRRYRLSAERVMRVLELRYERQALRLARHRISSPRHRANALEVLDTLIEPRLRPMVMPYIDPSLSLAERASAAGALCPVAPELSSLLEQNMAHPNPYVVLLTLDTLEKHPDARWETLAAGALRHAAPSVREGAIAALHALAPESAAKLVSPLCDDPDPVVRRYAREASRSTDPKEPIVHTTIEKILLLQSAPLFRGVDGEDLMPLARVAEEVEVDADQIIFEEGDHGTDLFLIVSGRVAVTREGEPIASLGPGDAFGEMAILDEAPRSATARAQQPTLMLRIGSEEFYEILHEQVEIAEGVIRLLTQRLREATRALAAQAQQPATPPLSSY